MENVSGQQLTDDQYFQLTDDQYFLLYFIMGAYFAPDLKEGKPNKSALQRRAENLPQYHANDLAGSCITTTVMGSIYYYTLRKAEQSVVVKQPLLLHYIDGTLPNSVEGSATYPKFDELFPPELHKRPQFENKRDVIDNIVFVNNPETGYINPRDIERFKRLAGLEDFLLDRQSAMLHLFDNDGVLFGIKNHERSMLDEKLRNVGVRYVDYIPCTEKYPNGNKPSNSVMMPSRDLDQGMIFLPSFPSREELSNLVATVKCGFALTGSAARGHVGPVLGLMDIGEAEDSYLFRVSLPGVRREERDFSCEVESDGKVIIKGVTVTGERTVQKYSQAFEMQSQNLCPPGPFSIAFKLPGPVDPQQFHGTFATDGIFEGIALKSTKYTS